VCLCFGGEQEVNSSTFPPSFPVLGTDTGKLKAAVGPTFHCAPPHRGLSEGNGEDDMPWHELPPCADTVSHFCCSNDVVQGSYVVLIHPSSTGYSPSDMAA